MPKVSVVLPVYNGARFVGAAIDSVLAQTCADWELLVINDGSTDDTPAVLARYSDPRIRVTHKANGGESSARNAALDQAVGQYIGFLDADDLYLPNALADLTAYLDTHPQYGVVFADGDVIDEDGNHLMTLTEHRPGIYTGDVLEPMVLDAAILTVPVCTLVRRAAMEQAGARFDRSLVIGPDWDFWIQLARCTHFGYLGTRTCQYRVHTKNITRTAGWQKRRRDLVAGRRKVLDSHWFGGMSLNTRYRFLYHLVIHLLDFAPEDQHALLQSSAVQALPGWMQANLWRQVGVQAIQNRQELGSARACLQTAVAQNPRDRKARAVLALTRLGTRPARTVLGAWNALHNAIQRARQMGKKRSRPMPHQLQVAKRHQ